MRVTDWFRNLCQPHRRVGYSRSLSLVALESLENRQLLSALGGNLDPSFGSSGLVEMPGGAGAGTMQPDGKILFVGNRQLGRLTPAGVPDPTFGTDGVTATRSNNRSLALQPDGKIVVGGGQSGFSLERFHADGQIDHSFGDMGRVLDGSVASSPVWDVAVQPDGKILAVGFGRTDFVAARYHPDGSPDHTFGTRGVVQLDLGSSDFAADLVLRPDGKIILLGGTGTYPRNGDFGIVQLNPDGSLDQSFGDGGIVVTDVDSESARSGALMPDGRLVVVGAGGGLNAVHLARYLVDGTPDPSFGSNGIVVTTRLAMADNPQLALQHDGRIIVGFTASRSRVVSRYNLDGSLDTTFDSTVSVPGSSEEIAIQPDGRIIVFGDGSVARYLSGEMPGTLSGQIWKDTDGNGVKGVGENGWNDRLVEITDKFGQVRSRLTTESVDVDRDGRIDPATETGIFNVSVMPGDWTVQLSDSAESIPSGMLTDTASQDAFRLDRKINIRSTGKLFENAFGGGEKWLYASAGWIYVTPNGGVYRWTAQGTQILEGELLSQLDHRFHQNPNLIFDAQNPNTMQVEIEENTTTSIAIGQVPTVSVSGRNWLDANSDSNPTQDETWVNGQKVELFDTTGRLVRSTWSRDIDLNNDHQIDAELESGHYLFSGLRPGTYFARRFFDDSERSSSNPAAVEALQLDRQFKFRSTADDFLNWGGQNEKWVWSQQGWHYITPDGTLRRWNGDLTLTGTVVSRLTPSFWQNPALLSSPEIALWEQLDVLETLTGNDIGVRVGDGS